MVGESPTCVDWSSHSTEPHAHCILIFWRALPYDILVMAYLRNLPIRTYNHTCIYISHCCIISCVYTKYYLLTELLNSPSHYYSFQAYSLIAGYFCWTFKTCFFVVVFTFLLCKVSAPKLWIILTLVLRQLNYIMKLVLLLVLRWSLIELFKG